MNTFFKKLIIICLSEGIDSVWIRDYSSGFKFGNVSSEFVIMRGSHENNWHARIVEPGRGDVYKDVLCDNERDACKAFIEISENWLHLSKYLPDFAASE